MNICIDIMYVTLNRFNDALDLYTRDVELKRKLLGDSSTVLCNAYARLAAVHCRLKSFEQAEQMMKRALQIATQSQVVQYNYRLLDNVLISVQGDVAKYQQGLGMAYLQAGDGANATSILQKALLIVRYD